MSSHHPRPPFPSRRELREQRSFQTSGASHEGGGGHENRQETSGSSASPEHDGWGSDDHDLSSAESSLPSIAWPDQHESPKVENRGKRRSIWRTLRTLLILILVLALVCGGLWFAFKFLGVGLGSQSESDDYPGPGTGTVSVTVEPDDTGTAIGQKLAEAGVVKTTAGFTKAFQANQASTSIQPGTYTLKSKMTSSEAVAALLNEKNRSQNVVTVVPGATYWQVAEQLNNVPHFSPQDVQSAMKDTSALGLPPSAKGNIEGWLLPGSYEFRPSDTPSVLLQEMITARIGQLDQLKIPDSDREVVLTKASIIEREVHREEYYPKVARVIDNRLSHPEGETKGMLQMDSTVLYGLHRAGGIPTSSEVQDPKNPYNTYQNPGLPPSPIGTPSEKAIESVLHPESGSWLYFVTIDLDTGETLFASTSDEQAQNVKKLNQYCSAHSDKCNK